MRLYMCMCLCLCTCTSFIGLSSLPSHRSCIRSMHAAVQFLSVMFAVCVCVCVCLCLYECLCVCVCMCVCVYGCVSVSTVCVWGEPAARIAAQLT